MAGFFCVPGMNCFMECIASGYVMFQGVHCFGVCTFTEWIMLEIRWRLTFADMYRYLQRRRRRCCLTSVNAGLLNGGIW